MLSILTVTSQSYPHPCTTEHAPSAHLPLMHDVGGHQLQAGRCPIGADVAAVQKAQVVSVVLMKTVVIQEPTWMWMEERLGLCLVEEFVL